MPERILRHLETIERMAKTASHTVDCLKKLAHLALLLVAIFAVFRVGSASSDYQDAAAVKEHEIAEAVREIREQLKVMHTDTEAGRDTMIRAIESMKGLAR